MTHRITDGLAKYPGHSDTLPRVLCPKAPYSAISMVRALKQAVSLLEDVSPDDDSHEDRLNASIDDLDVMLKSISTT